MYYLTGRRQGEFYGVVDTSDWVENYLSVADLLQAESCGLKVYGMVRKSGQLFLFGLTGVSVRLMVMTCPSPVRVRLSAGLSYMQTIYMGYRVHLGQLEFVFFNDSGMSGLCVLSSEALLTGGVALDFDNVDDRRAKVLMRRLKDSGSFVL